MCRYIDGFRCDNLDFLFRPCECSFPVIILRTFESVLVDGIVDNDLRDFVGCEIMVDLAVKTVEGKIVKGTLVAVLYAGIVPSLSVRYG